MKIEKFNFKFAKNHFILKIIVNKFNVYYDRDLLFTFQAVRN
jgi:hypothetical protein